MNSSATIINEDTVRISMTEYRKLLEYKAICKDFYTLMRGEQE